MSPELARLILAQICLHACMAGMRLAAPLLALKQGYSPVAIGVLLALFSLMQVILALPAGRFADRHGLRKPVMFSVCAATLGAGLAAAMPVFGVLCAAALLTGGASGAAIISLQRHVGRAAKGAAALKQVFSWMAIGPALANFVGPLSAGLLIDYAGPSAGSLAGFQTAFFALALLPLITAFWIRRTQELPPVAQALAGEGAKPKAWDLLREGPFRRLLALNWCLSACWDIHTFVVPVLGHQKGISAASIGAILGAFAIAATGVRLVLPFVASRLEEWRVLAFAMLTTALLFAVYPLMPSALAMGACSLVLGVVLGSVNPMIMSLLHQLTPEARHGEALGLRLMMVNASSVAVPLLSGSAGAVLGVAGVFWVVGVVVAAGSRLAWRIKADQSL
jgi:MFS family permease